METTLRKAQFKIETFPDEVFEGYTLDDDWNGWMCPYFDLKEAKRILNLYNQTAGNAEYNELND